jgi:hypothetical protein
VRPPARPTLVTAAFFAALASGVFSAVGGFLQFNAARDLAERVA